MPPPARTPSSTARAATTPPTWKRPKRRRPVRVRRRAGLRSTPADPPATDLPYRPGTVVLAGEGAGAHARELAERAGLPLFAEPGSGARSGDHLVPRHRLLLGTNLADRVRRVIVVGRPTLNRPVQRMCRRADEVVVVARRPGWPDPHWNATDVVWRVGRLPAGDDAGPDGWLRTWRAADDRLARLVDDGRILLEQLRRLTPPTD